MNERMRVFSIHSTFRRSWRASETSLMIVSLRTNIVRTKSWTGCSRVVVGAFAMRSCGSHVHPNNGDHKASGAEQKSSGSGRIGYSRVAAD